MLPLLLAILCLSSPLTASAVRYHVATNGSHTLPYANWTTAATNIQAAIDQTSDGDTVMVYDGTYYSTATAAGTISNGITVVSTNGAAVTILDGQDVEHRRGFVLTATASNAVIEGFTIEKMYGGRANPGDGTGGGIYMLAGRVNSCIITNNRGRNNGSAGGFYMFSGIVSNCFVVKNDGWIHAGGALVSGGLVVDCEFSYNKSGFNTTYDGGGIYINGAGEILNCDIHHNEAGITGDGGGIYMTAGTVRNCLIRDNKAAYSAGIKVATGCLVENCVIVRNEAGLTSAGAGINMTGGTVRNTVSYYNQPAPTFVKDTGADLNVNKSGGLYEYSCSFPLIAGDGNISAEPLFADPDNDDFHLIPGSPCIDTGTNIAAVTTDIDGTSRPLNGSGAGATHDMGVYEAATFNAGALRCGMTTSTNEGMGSLQVVLTAEVVGADTTITYYGWDYDNNGTPNVWGSAMQIVTNTFLPGLHTIFLTVSNVSVETATCIQSNIIRVAPAIAYVSTNGSRTYPYDTWATATTNVQDAIDATAAGGEVVVSNGVYKHTSQISLVSGITLRSVNGSANTWLARNTSVTYMRIINVGHTDAIVDGFTITNGNVNSANFVVGAGLYLTAGTVKNCRISKNNAGSNGSYGGIRMTGGTVTNCTINDNMGWMGGSGIYLGGGLITHCLIRNNGGGRGDQQAGGVRMLGGILRNSIIRDNASGTGSGVGGGISVSGGTILNCTIAHNDAGGVGGGVYIGGACGITNCIIYDNKSQGVDDDTAGSTNYITYSCAADLSPASNGNISGDPAFTDPGSRDYTLLLASPCIDAGTNLTTITSDYAGDVRPEDGDGDSAAVHDMGAYEAASLTNGPLRCDFSSPVSEGLDSTQAVLTVTVAGNDTNVVYYWWDLDNDGNPDLQGTNLSVITNTFGPGYHDVSVIISNGSAEVATIEHLTFIQVSPTALYVALDGSHTEPYTNWAMASTSIYVAVDLALDGATVNVQTGMYSMNDQVMLDEAITVRGQDRETTILDGLGGDHRIFQLANAGGVIDSLTISNGYLSATPSSGAGIYMTGGLVTNCTITKCWASNNKHGGGIYITAGLVVDCTLDRNTGHLYGGGAYMSGGMIRNSILTRNISGINGGYDGGGAYVGSGAILRNCLVAGNKSADVGGGILLAGGSVENCTVTGNQINNNGGGITRNSGVVTNCIIYDNVNSGGTNDISGDVSSFWYSCSPDLTHGQNNNTTNVPQFETPGNGHGINFTNGVYKLLADSPGINAGTNAPWMTAASDLAGVTRLMNKTVEMGAYETFIPASGTVIVIR